MGREQGALTRKLDECERAGATTLMLVDSKLGFASGVAPDESSLPVLSLSSKHNVMRVAWLG